MTLATDIPTTPAGTAVDDPVALARELAAEFRQTVVERERAGDPPTDELAQFRASGLVNLKIPVAFGGGGGTWRDVGRVIVELSKADPNIGGLAAYHYHNFTPPYFDFVTDAEAIQRRSAENRWLWGHITHPTVRGFTARPRDDGGFVISGTKPLNTGPATGDVMTVLAERTDRKEAVYAYIPTDREGIIYHGDWDHLGLRRTATQTVTFDNVRVGPEEVIPNVHGRPILEFPPFYAATGWVCFGAIYVGAALGALETAREYTLTRQRSHTPGVERAADDPFIQLTYGRLWIAAQAALAYLERAAGEIDALYAARRSLTPEKLGHLNMRTEAFRIVAGRTALEVSNRIYDALGGGGVASADLGLDRYWRDVRIHTLHAHPLSFEDEWVGGYIVNGDTFNGPPLFPETL